MFYKLLNDSDVCNFKNDYLKHVLLEAEVSEPNLDWILPEQVATLNIIIYDMDSTQNIFIPKSIKDIILYYLNPHELYLEELKDKTKYIAQISDDDFILDYSCTEYIIVNCDGFWEVGPPEYSNKKIDIMFELNARMYDINKMYIKHQERTNRCYMHY